MPPEINATVSEATKRDLDARQARINNHLSYLSEQCSKQHYFNAMHGVSALIGDMMRDFQDALNPDSPRSSPIPGEAQATREGEKYGWVSLGDLGRWHVYSKSGRYELNSLGMWQHNAGHRSGLWNDKHTALAALNACNTPPPDWNEPPCTSSPSASSPPTPNSQPSSSP